MEEQIDSLGIASANSGKEVLAIDSAYAALSEKEQAKVSNYGQYLGTVGDFAIEVLCPAYQVTYRDQESGYSDIRNQEAASVTLQYDPFATPVIRSYSYEHQSWESKISPDALSFGRSKGKLVFVNSKYVTVTQDKNGHNQRVLVWQQNECPMTYHTGTLMEDYPY